MIEPNPLVDAWIARLSTWRPEMEALRQLCLASGLKEELKWGGQPCYEPIRD